MSDKGHFDTSTGQDDGPWRHSFSAFDTLVELQAFGDADACNKAFDKALEACRDYERRFSAWLPDSDIGRLNSSCGRACAIHPDTAGLLSAALSYCEKSQGTFDITMMPAIRLWGFREGRIPQKGALKAAMQHVDWRKLRVFEMDGETFAQLTDPEMAVDLGGIAKGWIADRLVDSMRRSEPAILGFSVNLGGNVAVWGEKPDNSPWNVGIRDPLGRGSLAASVALRNASVVTSGITERCFTSNGHLYHHILDTRNGLPVETDLASASVVAKRSIDAEGFSTTLLALGSGRAQDYVRTEPAIEAAVLITRAGEILT